MWATLITRLAVMSFVAHNSINHFDFFNLLPCLLSSVSLPLSFSLSPYFLVLSAFIALSFSSFTRFFFYSTFLYFFISILVSLAFSLIYICTIWRSPHFLFSVSHFSCTLTQIPLPPLINPVHTQK